jgi:hypothetical protein
MKLHSALYRAARIANNLDAIAHPKRAPRRAKNIAVGRVLGRAGFWRNLWK